MDPKKKHAWSFIGIGVVLLNVPRLAPAVPQSSSSAGGDVGAALAHMLIAISAFAGLVFIVIGIVRLVRNAG